MKYSPSTYAQALSQVMIRARKGNRIAENFFAMLKKNGDERHLAKILKETERLMHRHDGTHQVTIESARVLSQSQKKGMKSWTGAGDHAVEKINPALIAGVRIIVDDERQFDGSLKGKLDKMFGSI